MANRSGRRRSGPRRGATGGRRTRSFWFPLKFARTSKRSLVRAAANCAVNGWRCFPRTRRSIRNWRLRLWPFNTVNRPKGWDAEIPTFPAGSEGDREPGFFRQGAQRHRQASPVAHWRFRGSLSVDQDAPYLRGCWRRQPQFPRGKKSSFWSPGARHGSDSQRTGTGEVAGLRLRFLDIQRLRQGVVAAWPPSWSCP